MFVFVCVCVCVRESVCEWVWGRESDLSKHADVRHPDSGLGRRPARARLERDREDVASALGLDTLTAVLYTLDAVLNTLTAVLDTLTAVLGTLHAGRTHLERDREDAEPHAMHRDLPSVCFGCRV